VRFEFSGFVLDTAQRELRDAQRIVSLEPQAFDLLLLLLQQRDRVVGKNEILETIWAGKVVSDASISVRINAVRRAIGDTGTTQALVRTYPRRGFRFVGPVLCNDATPDAEGTVLPPPPLQRVSFCRTVDGVDIATADIDDGEALIRLPTLFSHLEFDWKSPLRAPLLHALRGHCRQIRYDGRCTGLSERNIGDIRFEDFLADLDAVVKHYGLRRYGLLALSGGVPIAIAHAARHPDRVSRLVLHAGYAVGNRRRGSPDDAQRVQAGESMLRLGWGKQGSAYLRSYGALFMPQATPAELRWLAAQQQAATTGDAALKLRRAWDDCDVTGDLGRVRAPTLVLHCGGDALIPQHNGRSVAAGIADARFVSIDSDNHIPSVSEPAWSVFTREINAFLDTPDSSATRP
jgi:DNA-binding winged helix-turn-helix (wHTH) protein/pimeloyl-ACP methyl ester carboxylesterase